MVSKNEVVLGLVQMSMSDSQEKNLTHAVQMIERAANEGAQMVCLPELFTSRYFAQYRSSDRQSKEGHLESIPGRTTEVLSSCAAENKIVLIGGSIYEIDGDRSFNTSVIIDRDGEMIGKYRKVHIPHDENFYEQDYFEPGDCGFKVFDTAFAKIGVLICYDQWFPEAARSVALMGADIIFYPTAIGTVRGVEQTEGDWQDAWENVMRGHAIANGIAIAAVNRVGREDQMDFWGGSFVVNAFGRTLVRGGKKEEVVISKVDLDHGKNVKEGWRFFYNRRPECYSRLVEKKEQA